MGKETRLKLRTSVKNMAFSHTFFVFEFTFKRKPKIL